MGKASRSKHERSQLRRDRPNLLRKVREQRDLLRALGDAFDAGTRIMGFPLSTAIRVLVHDAASSHALLAQTGDLEGLQLLDTSLPLDPSNLLAHGGLVIMEVTGGVGANWVPRCSIPGPPVPRAEPRDVLFSAWWKSDVMKDHAGVPWSRSRMVLAIANKEGGAHVDPSRPLDIQAIEDENSMGWTFEDPIVGAKPMSEGPLMPSVRQIAYELEQTITRHFGLEIE